MRAMRAILTYSLLLAGAPCAAPAQHAGPAAPGEARLHGEFGLWVELGEDGREVAVHWVTARPDSGTLRVLEGAAVRRQLSTPVGRAHRVSFARAGAEVVTLEFGAASDPADRHRTTVDLRPPRRERVSAPAADSLYVVGDVHGEFDRLLQLLRNAGLVDAAGAWSGGRRQLALLGDLVDRGPDATRTLWYVYGLEREAARAGGRVLAIMGNHEAMVLTDDLRYVHDKERAVAAAHGVGYARLFHPRSSVLGRWLASKPALARVGRVLLAHGGVPPTFHLASPEALDDSLAAHQKEELFLKWADTTYTPRMDSASFGRRWRMLWGDDSVLWHRGYVQSDTLEAGLAAQLRRLRADVLVVGHTPQPTMTARYGGRLIATHARQPAMEMLLLVRERGGHRRFRLRPSGGPEEF